MSGRDPSNPHSRLILVLSSASSTEGLLAKGFLESEGISVLVKGESEGPYRLGQIYLWVAEEDEGRARALLESARSGGAAQGEAAGDSDTIDSNGHTPNCGRTES
jgi:hypothetical protein